MSSDPFDFSDDSATTVVAPKSTKVKKVAKVKVVSKVAKVKNEKSAKVKTKVTKADAVQSFKVAPTPPPKDVEHGASHWTSSWEVRLNDGMFEMLADGQLVGKVDAKKSGKL